MKKLLLLSFLLSCFLGFAQCPTEDVIFTTQAEVDNFATNYPGCTMPLNEIRVESLDITNLQGFSVCTHMEDLVVFNTNISDLSGLDNLETMGKLTLWNNQGIQDLTGLDALQTLGGLEMFINNNATSLSGAPNLQGLSSVFLFENDNLADISQISFVQNMSGVTLGGNALTSLAGLENLESVDGDLQISSEAIQNLDELASLQSVGGSVYVQANESLQDISALGGLNTLEDLFITENYDLVNLSGLENITTITGRLRIGYNTEITNLSFLSNLSFVNFLDIYDNDNLMSLDGLENLGIINERLLIISNPSLTDVSALSDVSSLQIEELALANNTNLAVCANPFLCGVVSDASVFKTIGNNATGCSTIEEIQDSCLLGSDAFALSNIGIMPNPVSDVLTVYAEGSVSIESLEIHSLLGQKLLQTPNNIADTSYLSQGVYVLTVYTDRGMVTKKIIKE